MSKWNDRKSSATIPPRLFIAPRSERWAKLPKRGDGSACRAIRLLCCKKWGLFRHGEMRHHHASKGSRTGWCHHWDKALEVKVPLKRESFSKFIFCGDKANQRQRLSRNPALFRMQGGVSLRHGVLEEAIQDRQRENRFILKCISLHRKSGSYR